MKPRNKKTYARPSLNAEQQAVVEHAGGPLRVSACAGSGKTTALIERVAHLVEVKRVPPARILLISFSKAAKEELQHRLQARLPAAGAKECARTFHSLGLMIFQKEIDPERDWHIDAGGGMYNRLIERASKLLDRHGASTKDVLRLAELMKSNLVETPRDETMRRLGSRMPTKLMRLAHEVMDNRYDDFDVETLLRIYFKTEEMRKTEGVEWRGERRRFVTYHDMVYESARLLGKSDVRERWADKWTHVLQDECQDENEAQAVIAEALAGKHRNYVIVGDPAQAIFAFRGASPDRMVHFEKRWPGAKTIFLFRNYRSGIEIVKAANDLVDYMPVDSVTTDDFGCPVDMRAERQTHAYLAHHCFGHPDLEAKAVADNITAHSAKGIPYSEQAVLLRVNKQSRPVEACLATRGIPYRLIAGSSLFDTLSVRVLLGYLRFMTCNASKEDTALVLNHPPSRLGKSFLAQVLEKHDMVRKDWLRSMEVASLEPHQRKLADAWAYGLRQWMADCTLAAKDAPDADLYKAIERASPHFVLKHLLSPRGRLQHLLGNDADSEDSNSLEGTDDILEFSQSFATVREMLEKVDLIDRHRAKSSRATNAVTISTIHRSKGREWGCVYLCGASAKMIPHFMGIDQNEERRLFYVACTRAKDELWVSHCLGQDGGLGDDPSPFIAEAGIPTFDTFEPGVRTCKEPVGAQTSLAL
jgi:DNA helicase II / ATP-dependent DNA helicase PcrA